MLTTACRLNSPWEVDGIVERFKELHAIRPQISCTGIARRLSREFSVSLSRNSVIGKCHRLGLPKREVGFIKSNKRSKLRALSIQRQPRVRARPVPVRTERIIPRRPPKPIQYTKFELRRMLTAAVVNTGGVLV